MGAGQSIEGKKGERGETGSSIINATATAAGLMTLSLSDGKSYTVQLPKGSAGTVIKSVGLNADGKLVFVLKDSNGVETTTDPLSVKGDKGLKGDTGTTGTTGTNGTNGEVTTSAMGAYVKANALWCGEAGSTDCILPAGKTKIKIGAWSILEEGGNLVFQKDGTTANGTDKGRIEFDSLGNVRINRFGTKWVGDAIKGLGEDGKIDGGRNGYRFGGEELSTLWDRTKQFDLEGRWIGTGDHRFSGTHLSEIWSNFVRKDKVYSVYNPNQNRTLAMWTGDSKAVSNIGDLGGAWEQVKFIQRN